MFNLLPKAEKDAIRREYRIRLSVVILWFSFTTVLLASILLLPTYSLSTKKEKAALLESATLSKSVQAEEASRFGELLFEVKRRLDLVQHEPPEIYFYELIGEIANSRASGISLSNITITKAAASLSIDIGGIADTRNSLVAFQKALAQTDLFETVEFPVSNLAKDRNSEFAITAKGVF